ncbi:MAG: TraR/DksA C4-type zinc finger protein [Desulfobacterales bacterium]|nr:TraR/DksA C4-type zinc finger protein [Desulfobacterales bacterium]
MDDCDVADKFINLQSSTGVKAIQNELGRPGTTDCENCGEPIPEKRRRAMPSCRLCIDCQRDLEKMC